MSDDYLWDRSGPPDPEVERLERVLGTLRYTGRGAGDRGGEGGAAAPAGGEGAEPDGAAESESAKPGAPAAEPGAAGAPGSAVRAPIPIASARRASRGGLTGSAIRRVLLLAAAAIALGAAAVWVSTRPASRPVEARRLAPAISADQGSAGAARPPGPAWRVEPLAGVPSCGPTGLRGAGELGVGQWLETDGVSSARIEIPALGHVEVGAQSRVRLAATGPDLHRLELERGEISARVNAPPRLFVVGTPAAAAVDLGCAYTLAVDGAGAATLRVSLGWVSLEDRGRASLVPAGATCRTRPGAGPGTPWFDDAPAALREALARFDFEGGGAGAVKAVLAAARRRDSLTVWHLLARVDGDLRRAVYDRLRELAPPPGDVAEPDVMRLDRPALDRWKDDLVVTW